MKNFMQITEEFLARRKARFAAFETHPDQINPLDRDNAMRRRIGEKPHPIKPHPDGNS